MEVQLNKVYPLPVSVAQAWAVLGDIRAVASCMPGAQITEQVDDTHYKGTVKTKVGPASMQFGGDIEVQGLDASTHTLQMLGKGSDKGGSSASMNLKARLEPGAQPGECQLVGEATVIVSGKLAQFGSRLLVPVSDAMLAQFAKNFAAVAAAVPVTTEAASVAEGAVTSTSDALATTAQTAADASNAAAVAVASAAAPVRLATPAAAPPVKELNALGLMWTVFKTWWLGLFARKA
jgi:uncharacterized protein